MKILHPETLLAVLLSAGPVLADQQVVELSDPGAPAELFFEMPSAVVEVVGSERTDLIIKIEESKTRTGTVVVPALVRGNRVEVRHPHNNVNVEVQIEVPHLTSLYLKTSNSRLIRVVGVHGEIEIANSNGGVELERVSGSLAVSTSNGHIFAAIEELADEPTVSLLTSNGEIRLTLPKNFEGRVLAETDTGSIESEFSVVPQPPAGLTRPGRVLSGDIGAGGPLLRLRTDNAGIRLLQGPADTRSGDQ